MPLVKVQFQLGKINVPPESMQEQGSWAEFQKNDIENGLLVFPGLSSLRITFISDRSVKKVVTQGEEKNDNLEIHYPPDSQLAQHLETLNLSDSSWYGILNIIEAY